MDHHRRTLVLFGAATVAFVGIILFAINSDDAGGGQLEGTDWTVEAVVIDGEPLPPIVGTVVTATFTDGELEGLGGCNSYFGSYETDGDQLTIGPLASTRRFCDEPPGVSDQENAYLGLLENARSYAVDGDRLTIDIGNGRQIVYRGS